MHKNYFSSGRWKDWFAFSRRERSGFAILLFILLIESLTLLWLHYTSAFEKSKTDFTAFEKEADAYYASVNKKPEKENEKGTVKRSGFKNENAGVATLFRFDPNKIGRDEWEKLGLHPGLVRTLINYRSKGGKFRKKEDLKKIYGLGAAEYARLEPYIELPEVVQEKQQGNFQKIPSAKTATIQYETAKIDIGIADTIELTHIRGVGAVFARRINNYRDKLGGFLNTAQLREVYGMNDSLFEAILPQVYIADTSNIRKILINSADYLTLRNHPYIGRDLAGIILNYRKQHGAFKSSNEVLKISLVTDELYRKLAPYLSME